MRQLKSSIMVTFNNINEINTKSFVLKKYLMHLIQININQQHNQRKLRMKQDQINYCKKSLIEQKLSKAEFLT